MKKSDNPFFMYSNEYVSWNAGYMASGADLAEEKKKVDAVLQKARKWVEVRRTPPPSYRSHTMPGAINEMRMAAKELEEAVIYFDRPAVQLLTVVVGGYTVNIDQSLPPGTYNVKG